MDHSQVGLQAAIRALSDVVSPAVDGSHAQARDQLRLVIDYLKFLSARLDHLPERRRVELAQHLEMGQQVQSTLGGAPAAVLEHALAIGEQTLHRPGAAAAELDSAAAGIAAAVSELVREASRPSDIQRMVERCILHASRERIAFERAWYLPLGLDPDPHEVRPMAEFIRPR